MTLRTRERNPLFAREAKQRILEILQESERYPDARFGRQREQRSDILGGFRLSWDGGPQIRERYGSIHTSLGGYIVVYARGPDFARVVYDGLGKAGTLTGGQPPDVQDEWLYDEYQQKGKITEESQMKYQELQRQRAKEATAGRGQDNRA